MASDAFSCKSCYSSFEDEGDLYRHLLSETERGVEKICPYCSKSFDDKRRFKKHLRKNHCSLECEWCDYTTYSREFYETHVEDEHIVNDWEDIYIHLDGMEESETIHKLDVRITPYDDFDETCEKIRGKIEHFMHYNTKFKRCRVTLAGSVAKGTAIHAQSDVDLVLFMERYDLTTMEDFIRDVKDILATLKKHIENGDMNWATEVNLKGSSQCSIQFEVQCDDNDELLKVNLLLAVDVFDGCYTYETKQEIYERMQEMSEPDRNYFNGSFTKLQLHMFKDVPDRLKDVIRIVKMWGKTIRKEEHCRVHSYFFELVVLHLWREDGSQDHISLPLSVKRAIHALCFCPSLRIVWPEEYDFTDYVPEKEGPMVLDPANPFRDVAPSMEAAVTISRRAVDVINTS